MTFYLGVVDPAADGSWGVVFPDLPGCYSAGDDMDDLFANSIEAIRMWAEDALARGTMPPARNGATLMADPEVKAMLREAGPTGCLIQVPLLIDGGRSVRATILAGRPFARRDRPGRQATRPHAFHLSGERRA